MFNKTISPLNISAFEKLANLSGMLFILNLIFILDIYANQFMKIDLFSPWNIIQKKISLGYGLGFIIFFSLIMAWIWPATRLFHNVVVTRLLYKIGIIKYQSLYERENELSNNPNFIKARELKYLSIKHNNIPALKLYNEWLHEEKNKENIKSWSLSLGLLLIYDMMIGKQSIIGTIASLINPSSSSTFSTILEVFIFLFLFSVSFVFFIYQASDHQNFDFIYLPKDILMVIQGKAPTN